MKKTHLLYLQLPLLDNDTRSERENFPFAAAYLDHALKQSSESDYYSTTIAPPEWDELDTEHLTKIILSKNIDILACTLYLWNIERTLRLAQRIKSINPGIKIVVGGSETSNDHPLLFTKGAPLDAVITGEGEGVFPVLLNAWRTNTAINFDSLSLQGANGWTRGSITPPSVDLTAAQPTEEAIMECVQNRPVIYLETVRGCPLTCSYCRYYQLHSGLRALTPEQVIQRIQRFRQLGATEIRFVDPTFNARPGFTQLLQELAILNSDQQLSFFAEIRSDTLSKEQAELMKKGNFTAVEVGVQSIDPQVLKNVNRPVRLQKTADGIQHLCDAGVQVVLDIMYGLPEQTQQEVRNSLDWALSFGDMVQVQCMQTLILPGTVLRDDCAHWKIEHGTVPPYNTTRTSHLSPDDIRDIETFLDEHPDLPADPITPRFCGQRLSGLFKNQHRINTDQLNQPIPGNSNRRCLLFTGPDLFHYRQAIGQLIEQAIQYEPDGLWQFVLVIDKEEPLNLVEELAATITKQPTHLLDRFASASSFGLIVSRRLYIRCSNNQISEEWRDAAEDLLRETFG